MSDTSIRKEIIELWYKEFPKTMNSDHMPEDLLNDLEAMVASAQREARWDGAIEATEMYLQELKDKRAVALVIEPEGDE